MRKLIGLFYVAFYLPLAVPASAQRLWIKPYSGYLKPQMSDLNDRIASQINGWVTLLGEPIPFPGKIDGNASYGAQATYYFGENYSVNLGLTYYEESVRTEHLKPATPTPNRFIFKRDVQLYDIFLSAQHHFNDVSYSQFNYHLGLRLGLALARAQSNTQSDFLSNSQTGALLPLTDTQGDFSGSSSLAALFTGFDFRLTSFFALWGEAGYQFAKAGQLEGTIREINRQEGAAFTTSTVFDYSGLYFRAGVGIGLPILK
jgi:hypothetical protein